MEKPKRRLKDGILCEMYWDQLIRACGNSPNETSKRFAEIMLVHGLGKRMAAKFFLHFSKLSLDENYAATLEKRTDLKDDDGDQSTTSDADTNSTDGCPSGSNVGNRQPSVPSKVRLNASIVRELLDLRMLSILELDVTISKRVDLRRFNFGDLETLSFSFPDVYGNDHPSDSYSYGYNPSSDDDSDTNKSHNNAGSVSEEEDGGDAMIPNKLKANILRIVEHNSATLKNLLNVPVGLLPIATGHLHLRKLKLSYVSRSGTDAELEVPRSDVLEFTSNNVLFPKFVARAVISEVIHRAGSVDAERDFDVARIKSLQPNRNVRKFSIELEVFYDDKPIELAELHDAMLHCFPELEELRVDITCQGTFGNYEGGETKLLLVERVNETAALVESAFREWQKPMKVFLKYCFEIRCEGYDDLPTSDQFPGFQEDENSQSTYVEDDDWGFGSNGYGANAAVCVKKQLDMSNDRRMRLSCNISRYEVDDTECDDFSGYNYGYD